MPCALAAVMQARVMQHTLALAQQASALIQPLSQTTSKPNTQCRYVATERWPVRSLRTAMQRAKHRHRGSVAAALLLLVYTSHNMHSSEPRMPSRLLTPTRKRHSKTTQHQHEHRAACISKPATTHVGSTPSHKRTHLHQCRTNIQLILQWVTPHACLQLAAVSCAAKQARLDLTGYAGVPHWQWMPAVCRHICQATIQALLPGLHQTLQVLLGQSHNLGTNGGKRPSTSYRMHRSVL